MGTTNWSASLYDDRKNLRATTGAETFGYHSARSRGVRGYDEDVAAGKIAADPAVRAAIAAGKCHPKLDPKGVRWRESRDSAIHPEAVPVIVLLDQTGSMDQVPKMVQEKLPRLMSLLMTRGYVDHPAILVGAIGDARNNESAPLQVGQFESGIEIEDDITNLFLEGNGGGNNGESYDLGLYFVARHTATDHWDKRGQKGFCFIVGDEYPFSHVEPADVAAVLGETLEARLTIESVVAECQSRWHTFLIRPNMTSHFSDHGIRQRWGRLLPECVIHLDDPATVPECIAGQVGLFADKSVDELVGDLTAEGLSSKAAATVGRALVPVGAGSRRAAVQNVPSSGAPSGIAMF